MADPAYIVDGVLTDGEAWVGIATTTVVGAATAIVTFTSTDDGQVGDFSQYMDLVVIGYARGSKVGTWNDSYVQVNNMTASGNYQGQDVYGNGSTVTPATTSTTKGGLWYMPNASATANVFGCCVYEFSDINSGKYKNFSTAASGDGGTENVVYLVGSTAKTQAPITEIDLVAGGWYYAAGSMFSLFGVLPRMVA